MNRLDVYLHRETGQPLLIVQSDLFSDLKSRIVVPLVELAAHPAYFSRMHPRFTIRGKEYELAPQFMAAISVGKLGERIGSFAERHSEVTAATDMILQGS